MKNRLRSNLRRRIEWLPARAIVVEPTAQRPFSEARADMLARVLDPDKLGMPLVAELGANGHTRFVAVDGQHRIAAVKKAHGDEMMIQCEVIHGSNLKTAADLFIARNSGKAPCAYDKFRVAVTAGHADETAVDEAVRALGLRIITNGAKEGVVTCVTTLMALRRLDPRRDDPHENLVTRTLRVALAAWGRSSSSFQGDVLRGLGMVLHYYAKLIDEERLVNRLAVFPKGGLGVLGRGRTHHDLSGGSVAIGCARAVLQIYNTGLRKQQLPAWDDRAAMKAAMTAAATEQAA